MKSTQQTARRTRLVLLLAAGTAALLALDLRGAGVLLAQQSPFQRWNDFGGPPNLPGMGDQERLQLSAVFELEKGTRRGRIRVDAVLSPGWHIYSLTQQPGGPQRTEIVVAPSDAVERVGQFEPDRDPEVRHYEVFDTPVEEYAGQVTWTAPLTLAAGVEPAGATILVLLDGQICEEGGVCIPIANRRLEAKLAGVDQPPESTAVRAASGSQAKLAGDDQPPVQTSGYRAERSHATIQGYLASTTAAGGETIQLVLTATPDPEWHVYAHADHDPNGMFKPTLIVVTSSAGWTVGAPVADSQPVSKTILPDQPPVHYYEGPVRWTIRLRAPDGAAPGPQTLTGLIGYQTCTSATCDMPAAAQFRVEIPAAGPPRDRVPLQLAKASYEQVAAAAAAARTKAARESPAQPTETAAPKAPRLDLSQLDIDRETGDSSLGFVLLTALAAGFILNFMPCVLPVIGLKIMAFVQQAGDRRGRIFVLNLWYVLGLMSVFLVLATLAVSLGLSWGQQFSSVTFNVILSSVVFVFALSFLGVWEIPIPGLVGSGKAGELAQQEGASGAFAKGVLATILATPCSGPMLGPALTWAVKQTPLTTYAGFACVGLGMASPYLVIGAFPKLIGFLPKPGAWMDTFKQIMGFVLLGTVVFLLSFIAIPYVVPTLALLIGLWAACWWIGRTPLTSNLDKKLSAWIAAGALAAVIGFFSFTWLLGVMENRFQRAVDRELGSRHVEAPSQETASAPSDEQLPWRPFSRELLEKLTGQRKTVFVDFTADW